MRLSHSIDKECDIMESVAVLIGTGIVHGSYVYQTTPTIILPDVQSEFVVQIGDGSDCVLMLSNRTGEPIYAGGIMSWEAAGYRVVETRAEFDRIRKENET